MNNNFYGESNPVASPWIQLLVAPLNVGQNFRKAILIKNIQEIFRKFKKYATGYSIPLIALG
jgi:hypothetical protein